MENLAHLFDSGKEVKIILILLIGFIFTLSLSIYLKSYVFVSAYTVSAIILLFFIVTLNDIDKVEKDVVFEKVAKQVSEKEKPKWEIVKQIPVRNMDSVDTFLIKIENEEYEVRIDKNSNETTFFKMPKIQTLKE